MAKWKPKMGNKYYLVRYFGIFPQQWENDSFDKGNYKAGYCIRTKKQAEAVLRRIRRNNGK